MTLVRAGSLALTKALFERVSSSVLSLLLPFPVPRRELVGSLSSAPFPSDAPVLRPLRHCSFCPVSGEIPSPRSSFFPSEARRNYFQRQQRFLFSTGAGAAGAVSCLRRWTCCRSRVTPAAPAERLLALCLSCATVTVFTFSTPPFLAT